MGDPERILVRGPNWLGDLVMATPGFRALRARHPEASLTLQVRPGHVPLLAGAPWFDEVVPVRSYRAGPLAIWREGRALQSRRFDLGICIPESFSSALLMRAAGVGRIAGFRRGGRGALLHQPIDPPEAWRRTRMVARERFVLDLLAALDCPERGTQLELFTTQAEEAAVDRLFAQRGVGADAPLVALAPGASFGPSKHWPAESFARVGDAAARAGAQVLLLGTPDEAAITARVGAAMEGAAMDLAGTLDLGALKALLRRARVLVCNDAGARHVAVAFGVHCIVLFGPTSLAKTGLNLEAVDVLEGEAECRPCYRRECPIDHRCMTSMQPGPVIDRLHAALEVGGAPQ